jgi:hypothetical protein
MIGYIAYDVLDWHNLLLAAEVVLTTPHKLSKQEPLESSFSYDFIESLFIAPDLISS